MDAQTILESDRRHELKEADGASGRYEVRLRWFREDGLPRPEFRHRVLWLLHNCVAHPLLGVLPNEQTVQLHHLTSAWLNKERPDFYGARVPRIPDGRTWAYHNLFAHMAIGLWPADWTFELHDKSAEKLGVPGWV